MIYWKLFLEFFHIGLFSFGGGYATLPFLYRIAEVQKWYTPKELADMIAISSITPGPVGVNVATFAGFTTSGIFGAFVATISIILPSYILIIIISKLLEKFKENKKVQAAIYALKPAGCGLLAAVSLEMFMKLNNQNFWSLLIFAVLFMLSFTKSKDPLFILAISAIAGLCAGFLGFIG